MWESTARLRGLPSGSAGESQRKVVSRWLSDYAPVFGFTGTEADLLGEIATRS